MAPDLCEQVLPRLEAFMKPFVSTFPGQATVQHANTYGCGLVANVEHKTIASIA